MTKSNTNKKTSDKKYIKQGQMFILYLDEATHKEDLFDINKGKVGRPYRFSQMGIMALSTLS